MSSMPASVGGRVQRQILESVLVNVALPLLLYALLSPHLSTLHTLMLVALAPAAESALTFVRRRRVDAFGLIVLGALLLGGGVVLLGGSARLILVREQLITGAAGLALLASLLLPRPLLYYLIRAAQARQEPMKRAQFDARWTASAPFRHAVRLMTMVFGAGVVVEALANIYLAYTVAIPTFLAVSPVVRYSIAGALILWLALYVRQTKRATGRHPLAL
jgi:intracellular septation protein A